MEPNENLSFQDSKDFPSNENDHDLHNYLIQPPETFSPEERPVKEEYQVDVNDIEEQQIQNEDPEDINEKMIIVQQFLQNPYDPTIREKLNFSPGKILLEKYPELQRLDLKNQYNFYKSLGNAQGTQQQPHWEQLYELDKVQRGAKEILKRNLEEEKKINSESECTFKPMMELTKDSKFGKKAEETPFLERTKLWAQQKKEKIEVFRIKDMDKDLTNTTIQTTKNSDKPDEKVATSNVKKGVDTFVKRQMAARQEKKKREELLSKGTTQHKVISNRKPESSGKKERTTQTKEFNFSSNRQDTSEKKNVKKEEKDSKVEEIYISDVSYGDALNYLHSELHKLDL